VISIIKQIQASIIGEKSDLGEYEENAREKQNIQYTRSSTPPPKLSHKDEKHQPPANQQIEKNKGV
jgi:hypothetical protein